MAKKTTTYVINLKRALQRRNYITQHCDRLNLDYKIIEAVDGSLLTQKEIEDYCDVETVHRQRFWLSNGAIGCALSHLNAYREFLKTNDNFAFIIEDDAVLPGNIEMILDEITSKINTDEVVLLYYTSFDPAKLSSINKIPLTGSDLCYPMDIRQTITATAYVIGREAATRMAANIIPVKVAADTWHYFYDIGCFNSFRVQFPMSVSTTNFKSSIDYHEKGSLKSGISEFIDKYKIPVLYQFFAVRRKQNLDKMLDNFELANDISPIDRNKQGEYNEIQKP